MLPRVAEAIAGDLRPRLHGPRRYKGIFERVAPHISRHAHKDGQDVQAVSDRFPIRVDARARVRA